MEKEKFIELNGRRFKSVMYLPEKHYEIEEMIGAALGGSIAMIFTALDGGGGLAAARQLGGGDVSAVDAAQLGGAFKELFVGLRSVGGFFKFAQAVLTATDELVDDKAIPLKIGSWRGEAVLIEDLVFTVLRFNFENYFLSRRAGITALLQKHAPGSSKTNGDAIPS